jgi:hypothetical protein
MKMKSFLRRLRRRQLTRGGFGRDQVLRKAVRKFTDRRVGSRVPFIALTDAEYGWGNELWAADEEYLSLLIREAERARGSIIECGSGLSTLILAGIARQTGAHLYSFEHQAEWRQRVVDELAACGLTDNTVYLTPLRSFGEYDWYDVPPSLPSDVSLVICDGPPAATRGGRYGAVPLLLSSFGPSCKILLDDAGRASEKEIVSRWEAEFGAKSEWQDTPRGYASITVRSKTPAMRA